MTGTVSLNKRRGKYKTEISRDMFQCEEEGPWTDEERVRILNGPLSFVRGWRFDHLPIEGCKNQNQAQVVVEKSPSISWATSNFREQISVTVDDEASSERVL